MAISDPNASNSPQEVDVVLNVYSAKSVTSPFGYFETPLDDSTVMSSIPVTGWVLHEIGVDSVKIYRDALPGEGKGLVYIGNAVFVEGARPDVEEAYPGYPLNSKAGWGYMLLTNFLPNGGNGTFTLHAVVNAMNDQQVSLGTKTIICDNVNAVRPFGAIDTPTQGGTASGSDFINWGWVLTPQPKSIPTDGHTIKVCLDGVYLGHPTYNIYRSDIATLFQGYANSDGAVGYFYLDTTLYTNGVHTIQWYARDNSNRADGIGSRYFSIQNTGGTTSHRSLVNGHWSLDYNELSRIPAEELDPVKIKKGYHPSNKSHEVYPDDHGTITIEIKEMERIEIHLEGTRGLAPLSKYTGYLVVGNQLKALPVGSHLDYPRGIFYWGPGPGFVGLYKLVFINNNKDRLRRVNIKILPKYK